MKVPTPTLMLLTLKVPTPSIGYYHARYQLQHSCTTTESTDSNTSATTTGTNFSTNATTTEIQRWCLRRTPIKMAMLRIIDSIQSPNINKESYKRKGSQMVLPERKKLKAQFPQYFRNMNAYSFLDFGLDEIKHLSSMVLTYTSAQRECSQDTDYARAVKRCSGCGWWAWPEST
ncbi:CFF_collapsed_G0013840.mRNA.1.CDS.1 [Saccharomyces cerevisiae]|nr:CFF_collapsed_G0013840.mRNA.1.CDS.1 [Saccharomyces cerevisiae]